MPPISIVLPTENPCRVPVGAVVAVAVLPKRVSVIATVLVLSAWMPEMLAGEAGDTGEVVGITNVNVLLPVLVKATGPILYSAIKLLLASLMPDKVTCAPETKPWLFTVVTVTVVDPAALWIPGEGLAL